MSTCRMCDKCGTIFSERAEGWAAQEGSISKRNPDNGRVEFQTVQMDSCPECTELMMAPPPRPMLEHGARNEYLPGTVESP